MVVLGWGSELRSDDAAGRRVAEAIAARRLPGVMVRAVHQLTPELATDLVGRRLAIFVDATVTDRRVGVRELTPAVAQPTSLSHDVDPVALLEVAALLGEPPARAVVVSVPAFDLAVGTALSPRAAAGVREAITVVAGLLPAGTDPDGAP